MNESFSDLGCKGIERFVDTYRRIGAEPFKAAANAARAPQEALA